MLNNITKRTVIGVVLVVLVFYTQSYANQAAATDRMNVLFLVVDDLNTWLLGDTNRYAGKVVAPDISRLADSGVLFSRAYRDSTIVVLIIDHGFHLAEKSHWQKGTLWEEATHSLMMWRVPGMTRAGSVSERFVSLQDIYPTLADLCRIEPPDYVDGRSLASLLKQPDAQWRSTAISALYDRYVSIRTERYRYIRYRDDQEEFYDCAKDPHEWTNQIGNRAYAAAIKTLRSAVPALSDMAPPMPSKKRKIR